jgi:hypothetical protein
MGLLETKPTVSSSFWAVAESFFFLAALPFEGDWEPSTLVFFLAGALVAEATEPWSPKPKKSVAL